MADITKEFLDELQNEFNYRYLNSKKINSLTKKLNEGNATAEDAFTFAKEVGNLRKLVLHDLITEDILTDEYLGYYNALDIFTKALYDNYELINNYCKSAFTQVNKRAGINLKGVSVDYDQDKTDGIIECAVKDKYTVTRAKTEEAVATNAKSYCDESVKKNAEFQYKSGLSPKIIRTAVGKTCKWCQSLAGTYDYYDVSDTGNDVFRRHSNCDCIVVYSPRKGKYQDVYSKQHLTASQYKTAFNPLQMKHNASNYDIYPQKGTKHSVDDINRLKKIARDKGFVLSDFDNYDGDLELAENFINSVSNEINRFKLERKKRIIIKCSYLLDKDTFAETVKSTISINGFAFRDASILKEEYQKLVDEGWFTRGSSYEDIAIHETAHVITYMNNLKKKNLLNLVTDSWNPLEIVEIIKNNISEYASSSADELIAEAYTAYKNNSQNEYVLKTLDLCGILKSEVK